MSTVAPPDNLRTISGLESRRSTRIAGNLPLVVFGQTKTGLSFQEKTSTVSFNLHGCRYPSRHEYPLGAPVSLRVFELEGEMVSPVIRAFVRSIYPPMNPRDLYQIGVELAVPANVWNIPTPPEDWDRFLGRSTPATARLATGAATALEPAPALDSAAAQAPAPLQPAGVEPRTGEVTMFPGPASTSASSERSKETAPTRPERVAITIDQLVTAMQGKLRQAAEKVVQTVLTTYLDEAVRSATARIEETTKKNLDQIEQVSGERFDSRMSTSREQILGHLETRLGEAQTQWKEQQETHRTQAEEISQRIEKLAADTQNTLGEMRKLIEKISREQVPQFRGKVEESLSDAAEEFEAKADRVADRQLVRVMEATRMVTREAAAQMDARVAESRAQLQSASNSTLEEFRRQAEVQVDLAVTETLERVRSTLSALDAENRSVCDARRRSLESEVARAAEQSTEQFRSGIKAFLYSCLVAAVGAVDEHTKVTLDGLLKQPGAISPEIASESGPPKKTNDSSA